MNASFYRVGKQAMWQFGNERIVMQNYRAHMVQEFVSDVWKTVADNGSKLQRIMNDCQRELQTTAKLA